MARTIRMLIPLIFLGVPYLTAVESRFTGKITYTYTPNIWQKALPDSRKLNTLALMGTRDPPTFEPPFRLVPRLLPLSDKLTVGIRVLDMGVRRINDDFAMYNSSFDMRAQFKDLVGVVKTFLNKNPKEFVIMIMHAESTAINSRLTECEILNTKYVQKYQNLFVQNWTLDDTVGQHRGKILLLEKSHEFIGCTTHVSCVVHDQQNADVPDNVSAPMHYVKGLQTEVRAQHAKCYLFYYTTHRDVSCPPGTSPAAQLALTLQLNESRAPQTVGFIPDYFINTKKSLHITVADLPTVPVINHVIESNTK